eukprot:jgi/Mesen1/1887/ME000143S00944
MVGILLQGSTVYYVLTSSVSLAAIQGHLWKLPEQGSFGKGIVSPPLVCEAEVVEEVTAAHSASEGRQPMLYSTPHQGLPFPGLFQSTCIRPVRPF